MRGLVDENGEIIKTEEEDQKQSKISECKQKYQAQYHELKDLKSEIERIQALLERCREKLQKDFEQWLQVMIKQKQMETQNAPHTSQNQNQIPVFMPTQASHSGAAAKNSSYNSEIPPYMQKQQQANV